MFAPAVAGTRPAARDSARPIARRQSNPEPLVASRQGVGNQARLRQLAGHIPLYPKLTIGRLDDPLEREADALADRITQMPAGAVAVAAAPPQVSRKCAACEQEEELRAQRSPTPSAPAAAAPASVHAALDSPAQTLDAATRGFFEPRFGRRLDFVRVHTDDGAAASAADLGAAAYTVGPDIIFGRGQFAPQTAAGRQLLAHELVHVVQQDGGHARLQRAPCRSAAQCTAPTAGDPARFSGTSQAAETARAAANAAAPVGSPGAALRARLGEHAVHIEKLLTTHGVPLRPEVFGFFVNSNLDPAAVGAQTNDCQFFPGGSPGGAPPDKKCIQVPAELEDEAKALDIVGPLTPAQQDRLANDILSLGAHEMQHATFDTQQEAAATRTIAAAADCSLDTIVTPPDITVEFLLSEISAIAAEYPVFFENLANSPHKVANLDAEERQQVFSSDEGLLGAIKRLQCVCSCATADSFVTQTVNLTIAAWAPATRTAFLKAMTGWMPSFWPKAIQQR